MPPKPGRPGASWAATNRRRRPGGRRRPDHASASATNMGAVLGRPARRRPHRIPLAARGPAPSVGTRQSDGRGQQWGRTGRVAARRRTRGGQGHPAPHDRLSTGRSRAHRPGHHLHCRAASAHAPHRAPSARCAGVRGARQPVRGRVRPAAGRTADPRGRRCRRDRAAHREAATVAPAYLLTAAGLHETVLPPCDRFCRDMPRGATVWWQE